jgi:hypothetical protein
MFLFDIKYGQVFQTVSDNSRQPNDPMYWKAVKTYKKVRKAYKGVMCSLIECNVSNPSFAYLFNQEIGTLIKLPLDTKVELPKKPYFNPLTKAMFNL